MSLDNQNQTKGLLPLVYRENNAFVDSRKVAECLGLDHKEWRNSTLSNNLKAVETHFGKVRFETTPSGLTNQSLKYALLTEDQALFCATLSRNSERVVKFKALLVEAFQMLRVRNTATIALPEVKTALPFEFTDRTYSERKGLDGIGQLEMGGDLWFSLADVCRAYDLGKPEHACKKLRLGLRIKAKTTVTKWFICPEALQILLDKKSSQKAAKPATVEMANDFLQKMNEIMPGFAVAFQKNEGSNG